MISNEERGEGWGVKIVKLTPFKFIRAPKYTFKLLANLLN